MKDTDTKVEAFYAKDGRWRDELAALRAILLDTGLSEEFKWRSPVYTAHGGNIATVWGMKDNAALSFFKGVLLKDPENILVAPGDNSRSVRMVKFTAAEQIAALEPVLKDYIREAAENEKAGLKVDFPKDDLDYPEELVDRLDGDPEFRAAFNALTPGRRRGWVLHFTGAKQSATRASRIEKAAPKILAGKGWNDR